MGGPLLLLRVRLRLRLGPLLLLGPPLLLGLEPLLLLLPLLLLSLGPPLLLGLEPLPLLELQLELEALDMLLLRLKPRRLHPVMDTHTTGLPALRLEPRRVRLPVPDKGSTYGSDHSWGNGRKGTVGTALQFRCLHLFLERSIR